jgi:hypothetical protein
MKKALVTAIALTLGLVAFAGCSSDDDKSSTSTTTGPPGKEAVCDARTKLQKNLDSLEDPSLLTEGKSGIQSSLDSLEKDLDNLTDAAKRDYQPQVDAVKSSLDDLKTAVKNLGDGSITAGISDVGQAVTKVGTTTETLLDQVKADCPS